MSTLPEFVGTIHIFLGPYRGNPIALYLRQEGESCQISPTTYPWNKFVGKGETVNKAAADFDAKWKEGELTPEMYSGPHWEGGIKPEKPKPPPKPAAPAKPATAEPGKAEATGTVSVEVGKTDTAAPKPQVPSPASPVDRAAEKPETSSSDPSPSSPTPAVSTSDPIPVSPTPSPDPSTENPKS